MPPCSTAGEYATSIGASQYWQDLSVAPTGLEQFEQIGMETSVSESRKSGSHSIPLSMLDRSKRGKSKRSITSVTSAAGLRRAVLFVLRFFVVIRSESPFRF